jgi:hypothetical protein
VPPVSVLDVADLLIVFMFECITVNPAASAAMARMQSTARSNLKLG